MRFSLYMAGTLRSVQLDFLYSRRRWMSGWVDGCCRGLAMPCLLYLFIVRTQPPLLSVLQARHALASYSTLVVFRRGLMGPGSCILPVRDPAAASLSNDSLNWRSSICQSTSKHDEKRGEWWWRCKQDRLEWWRGVGLRLVVSLHSHQSLVSLLTGRLFDDRSQKTKKRTLTIVSHSWRNAVAT